MGIFWFLPETKLDEEVLEELKMRPGRLTFFSPSFHEFFFYFFTNFTKNRKLRKQQRVSLLSTQGKKIADEEKEGKFLE
jgi:hypothetical protein